MNKQEKTQRGITLIALVITIIVMLILVGVTISMAVNGGLFEKAGEAVRETNTKLHEEQLLTNTDIIDYYVNRKPAVTSLKAYSTALLNDDGVLDENTKYESGYNIAVIPKGFKIAEVAEEQPTTRGLVRTNSKAEPSIEDGLVIEDAEGNQFVWIPVKDGEFERTAWLVNEPIGNQTLEEALGTLDEEIFKKIIAKHFGFNSIDEMIVAAGCSNYDELLVLAEAQYGVDNTKDMIRLIYSNSSWPGKLIYTEDLSTDPTGEYENMVNSVNKYGGFYIGRYEAGAQNEEGEKVARTYIANETSEMVVKKDQYPYIYVGWANEDDYTTPIVVNTLNQGYGAVYLSKNMYTGDEYGVASTLCYGVQWDAALRFIKEEKNVTDDMTWGNYTNNEFTFTGEYSSDGGQTWSDDRTTKPASKSWLLTTGASEANKAKNIYDLAGNVMEWTMEYYASSRAFSGCSFDDNHSEISASYRYHVYIPAGIHNNIGFRPTLYIK